MPKLRVNGVTLAYTDQGSGPAVILVHGSGSSRDQWWKLVNRLATRYRVLAPDLYGYGGTSPWPADRAMTESDESALVRVLADLADGPLHLVGHSYGACLCLAAALDLEDRLSSLTLIEPVSFHLLRLEGESEAWSEIRPFLQNHIDKVGEGDLEGCANAFLTYWVGPGAFQALPDEMRANFVATMPKIAAECRLAFVGETGLQAYGRITAPTLLMLGGRTTLAARRVVELLSGSLPNRRFIEIEGANHMAPITHADTVNRAIEIHVDGNATIGTRGQRAAASSPTGEAA